LYAQAVDEYWSSTWSDAASLSTATRADSAYQEIHGVPAGESLRADAVELGDVPTGDLFAVASSGLAR
jgi:hypothetical protein